MLGYFITAVVSATITMIVMACFQVGKDPREDVQQIQPPRHELISVEHFPIVNVWAECFLNDEDLNNPEPYVRRLVSYRLKEKLVDAIWENVSVSRCDDKLNRRVHYLANIKVLQPTVQNPLVQDDTPWKS